MGKVRAAGRVGSDFLSVIAGRVGSSRVNVWPGRVQEKWPVDNSAPDSVQLAHDGIPHTKTSVDLRCGITFRVNVWPKVSEFHHMFNSLTVHWNHLWSWTGTDILEFGFQPVCVQTPLCWPSPRSSRVHYSNSLGLKWAAQHHLRSPCLWNESQRLQYQSYPGTSVTASPSTSQWQSRINPERVYSPV